MELNDGLDGNRDGERSVHKLADELLAFMGSLRRLKGKRPEGPGTFDRPPIRREDGREPREWRGQFRLLHILQHEGRMTMQQLAQQMDISPPSVTAMVRRLGEQDMVDRTRDKDDSRVFWITITDRGRATIMAIREERQESMRRLLAGYGAEDRVEITRAIEVLTRVLVDHGAPLRGDLPDRQDQSRENMCASQAGKEERS